MLGTKPAVGGVSELTPTPLSCWGSCDGGGSCEGGENLVGGVIWAGDDSLETGDSLGVGLASELVGDTGAFGGVPSFGAGTAERKHNTWGPIHQQKDTVH